MLAPSHLRWVAAVWVLAATSAAHAATPRLQSLFPCGGRQGSTVECTISGTDLDGASGLYFSHPGLTAQPVGANKFKVAVTKDVPIGQYDVRVLTPHGVSNFRAFVVGDWPEMIQQPGNDQRERAQPATLPVVINGTLGAETEAHYFSFKATKGQRVFINCWAWRIDSRMEGCLRICDAQGRALAYSGNVYGKDPFIDFTAPADDTYSLRVWDLLYGGGPGYFYRLHVGSLPHVDAVFPAAVRYGEKATVTVLGRNLPGGKPAPGAPTIDGQPLEALTWTIEAPAADAIAQLPRSTVVRSAGLDGMDFRLHTDQGSSNPVFVGFSPDLIVTEQEPNDDLKTAQKLPVPCDLTGTFGRPGDMDFYSIALKKGERTVVEVIGDRLGGFVDPVLTPLDATGKPMNGGRQVGSLRDNRFNASNSKDTHWGDHVARADGDIFLRVRDLYTNRAGPHLTYRLRIRPLRPSFRLVVIPASDDMPETTLVGRGGRQRMDVLAFREDGFDGPIAVEAADLPPGVTCESIVIGPGHTVAPLVFQAAADAALGHAAIRVIGKATIGSGEVSQTACGGGLVWPIVEGLAVSRVTDNIVLCVGEAAPFTLTAEPARVDVKAGEAISIVVKAVRTPGWADDIEIKGVDLPQGLGVELAGRPDRLVPKDAEEATVEIKLATNVRPGTYTIALTGAVPTGRGPKDKDKEKIARPTSYPSNVITITVAAAVAPKK